MAPTVSLAIACYGHVRLAQVCLDDLASTRPRTRCTCVADQFALPRGVTIPCRVSSRASAAAVL